MKLFGKDLNKDILYVAEIGLIMKVIFKVKKTYQRSKKSWCRCCEISMLHT